MTPRGPEFDELVGGEVPAEERERLRSVHELLVAAGPPPELSPTLEQAPAVGDAGSTLAIFPRRRRAAFLLIAAALAAAAFGGGYFAGGHGRSSSAAFHSIGAIQMHGTAAAPNALATIELGDKDSGGNWPMLVTVRGLPSLDHRAYYELYLTRHGRIAASCGTFTVHAGTTKVRLNAPYQLKKFDGWVVTKHVAGQPDSESALLTT